MPKMQTKSKGSRMYYLPYQPDEPLDSNLIIFFSDPDFSGNCLALWEYLSRNSTYTMIWFVSDGKLAGKIAAANIKCYPVARFSECNALVRKAKYVVCERVSRHRFPKPKGQIDIQLMSISHFVTDLFTIRAAENPLETHLLAAKTRSSYTDLFIANSEIGRINTSAIHYADPRKIFVTGSPRYDTMFNDDGKALLFSLLPELAGYSKIIFYCPSNNATVNLDGLHAYKNIYNLPDLDERELEDLLQKYNAAVILKLHMVDERYFSDKKIRLHRHCYQINSHSFLGKSIYHILNAFDIMITDVSQLANEFLLLDRPVLFNRVDYEKRIAQATEPLVNDEMLLAPGAKFRTSAEFIEVLKTALTQPNLYSTERKRACEFHHRFSDGNACKRVVSLMKNYVPIENIEHDIFIKSMLGSEYCKHPDLVEKLAHSQEQLNAILSSKSYRAMQKAIRIICPVGSRRRKVLARVKKVLGK